MNYTKIQDIIKKYKLLYKFESLCESDVFDLLKQVRITHIGFDIENGIITNIKWYFKSDSNVVENALSIAINNLEYSISMKEHKPNEPYNLRWNGVFETENIPYDKHTEIIRCLFQNCKIIGQSRRIFEIADIIMKATKSARYPLVGYGASHDLTDVSKINAIKLYYTFWQIKNSSDIYGKNDNNISLFALSNLKKSTENVIFRSECEKVCKLMFKLNNLLSMYSLNISSTETVHKLYFVTDDSTWEESLKCLHEIVFGTKLDSYLFNLFSELGNNGFRYEELSFAVHENKSMIKAYMMV